MDDALMLTERVAPMGAIVAVEEVYEVTPAGVEYLASHSLADAPDDTHG